MNKMVRLDPTVFWNIFLSFNDIEEVLDKQYGIRCIRNTYSYNIIDESKFALFMLTYPELIQKIYE